LYNVSGTLKKWTDLSSSEQNRASCSWWDGRDKGDSSGKYVCKKSSTQKNKGYIAGMPSAWEFSLESNKFVCSGKPDSCKGKLGDIDLLDKKGLESTQANVNKFVSACRKATNNYDFGYMLGDDARGSYCNSVGSSTCVSSPFKKDFCGDDPYEVPSEDSVGNKICCDGLDSTKTPNIPLTYVKNGKTFSFVEECVSTDFSSKRSKCKNTVSPRAAGKKVLALSLKETNSNKNKDHCWDKVDNDCNGLTDVNDLNCSGLVYGDTKSKDKGKLICGVSKSVCDKNLAKVFSKDPNFNPKNVAGMKCVDNTFTAGSGSNSWKIMKGLCDCSYKPSGTPTEYDLAINLPKLPGDSTYACIAPQEKTKTIFIELAFGTNSIQSVSSPSLKSNALLVKLINSETYEVVGKGYPSNSVCDLTVKISLTGKKLVFFNLKEHSCILKIKKK